MLSDDNPLEWIIHLIGPDDTLYSKGVFRALLRFPANYPFSPPSVQFTSSIIHPNIYNDGKVCITSLQTAVPDNLRTKDSCPKHLNWNPSIGVSGALLGVMCCLAVGIPSQHLGAAAACASLQHLGLGAGARRLARGRPKVVQLGQRVLKTVSKCVYKHTEAP